MVPRISPEEQGAISTGAVLRRGDGRDLERLADALWSSSSARRVRAAEDLHEFGPAAVKPLCEALRIKDPKVREAAAKSLGLLGEARAAEPLCEVLRDPEPGVQTAAAL